MDSTAFLLFPSSATCALSVQMVLILALMNRFMGSIGVVELAAGAVGGEDCADAEGAVAISLAALLGLAVGSDISG